MFLTETEAEARLAGLHRERSRLERAIADLTLFLAIGRQGGPDPSGARPPIQAGVPAEISADAGWPVAERNRDSAASPPDESGTDRSLARREGRLLMEAAAEFLAEAGRPLHAADILDGLTRRGLSVPGVDPVAALNTRLWKRSGPDGPFRRLGDAVYALSGGDEDDEA